MVAPVKAAPAFTVMGANVVIRPDEVQEKTTEAGIQYKTAPGDVSGLATIVAVGLGVGKNEEKEPWLKVGDRVVYRPFSGYTVVVPGIGECVVIEEEEIAVLFEDDQAVDSPPTEA